MTGELTMLETPPTSETSTATGARKSKRHPSPPLPRLRRYFHLPSFLSEDEQRRLASAALLCHARNSAEHVENPCPLPPPPTLALGRRGSDGDVDVSSSDADIGTPPPNDEGDGRRRRDIEKGRRASSSASSSSSPPSCPCHFLSLSTSEASLPLRLGLPGGDGRGGDVAAAAELGDPAVTLGRRAFRACAERCRRLDGLEETAGACARLGGSAAAAGRGAPPSSSDAPPPLTGLALLYGPRGSMLPHHDSPTQPGRREEWLVALSVGNAARFRADDEVLTVRSGDAVVMDSMAVLHGVEGIIAPSSSSSGGGGGGGSDCGSGGEDAEEDPALRLGLPVRGSRLGLLLWQGRTAPDSAATADGGDVGSRGMDALPDLPDGMMDGLFAGDS